MRAIRTLVASKIPLGTFELRLLARREAPRRWVIDLSRNDNVLLPPQRYFEIPHPEDRLFVPAEFAPLFVERGGGGDSTPASPSGKSLTCPPDRG